MDRPITDNSEERVAVDPSRICIVGFWAPNDNPIYIDDIYLDEMIDVTAIDDVYPDKYDPNEIVDVYSITGLKVRSKVIRKEATIGLPTGIYIVGRQKVFLVQ
jgi:hypothetical protein